MPIPGEPVFRGLAPTDLSRCDAAASFLQSGFWGSFKARFGWNARAFLVDWGEGGKIPLLVIRRRLGPGASFAYVPWGPELPAAFPEDDVPRSTALEALAVALKAQLPHDTVFVRFDPPWYTRGADAGPPRVSGCFRRAGADIQAPDTVVVDVSRPPDAVLAGMKPKWRYNIRLAEKHGVTVRRVDEEGLDAFYRLYVQTARRDRIAVHAAAYYRTLFAHAREYRDGLQDLRLYIAEHEGEALSALIMLIRGTEATYLYGASADHKRNLMAPYALQWQAMREAGAAGCGSYDLFGIPPQEDAAHPMAGLYRFKTGFGGEIRHRGGSWDYGYRPCLARLFTLAEALRKGARSVRKAFRPRTGNA